MLWPSGNEVTGGVTCPLSAFFFKSGSRPFHSADHLDRVNKLGLKKKNRARPNHGQEQEVGARLQSCATDTRDSHDISTGGSAWS